jgi:hypothetical protein
MIPWGLARRCPGKLPTPDDHGAGDDHLGR